MSFLIFGTFDSVRPAMIHMESRPGFTKLVGITVARKVSKSSLSRRGSRCRSPGVVWYGGVVVVWCGSGVGNVPEPRLFHPPRRRASRS